MFGLSCGVEARRWCVVNPYRVQWLVLVGSGGSLLNGGAWKAQGEPFQSPMVSHSWSWRNKWRGGAVKARVLALGLIIIQPPASVSGISVSSNRRLVGSFYVLDLLFGVVISIVMVSMVLIFHSFKDFSDLEEFWDDLPVSRLKYFHFSLPDDFYFSRLDFLKVV
ncbi:hypothetical protein DY000_02060585 [Brassica cretica]|uniref:CASP-like protein n=1 Tax=Brassica cretica TaxID=69181 RepID=A0ABQ7B1R3_BRACR|nr:hypothetical protein DY000_02060585 [Brassica cretica]